MDAELAPIVLFVYARPEHTRRTVEALRANRLASRSRLFVFSDGPKSDRARPAVEDVRRYVRAIDGFASVEIVEQERNIGLADSIIAGVTRVVDDHGRAIVLEDDIVTSPYFLDYMNDGLELYKDDEDVATIQGHIYPLDIDGLPQSYFLPSMGCWGWGTWARAWRDFEPDGAKLLSEIRSRRLSRRFDVGDSYPFTALLRAQSESDVDSWAIRWYATNFLLDRKGLYPSKSFVKNIGFDGSGEHCGTSSTLVDLFNGALSEGYVPLVRVPIQIDDDALRSVGRALRKMLPPPLPVRISRKLSNIIFRK
ncbi:MAG: glycosyltransferase [Synergistaceae bacterium]|nr:glycosyltransferase [Synergistaceae bacterium]